MKGRFFNLAFFFCIAGCQTSDHLIYVQETSLGVNVGVGTEGTQKFSLGYDRDVLAVVPKKSKSDDAMSLLSVNQARISGIADMSICEFVATGAPATKLAMEENAVTNLRNRVYEGDAPNCADPDEDQVANQETADQEEPENVDTPDEV